MGRGTIRERALIEYVMVIFGGRDNGKFVKIRSLNIRILAAEAGAQVGCDGGGLVRPSPVTRPNRPQTFSVVSIPDCP